MTHSQPFGPRPRRKIKPMITISAVVVALLACVFGVVIAANVADVAAGQAGSERGAAIPAATGSTTTTPAAAAAVEPAATLRPADVKISLKTLSKECFGSAGCNLDVRPVLDWPGDLADQWDITYVITYKEWSLPDGSWEAVAVDGEEIGTAQIRGEGDDYTFSEHHLMVFDRKVKPVIKIDQIERRG